MTDEHRCPVLGRLAACWAEELDVGPRRDLGELLASGAPHGDSGEAVRARGWMALDWLVRVSCPAWLRSAGLAAEADALADGPALVAPASVAEAGPLLAAARGVAGEAWGAARSTAWIARGPWVVGGYRMAVGAALERTVPAVGEASGVVLEDALAEVRGAALGAGRIAGRGARPPAVLGHAYDTAVDATYDTVDDCLRRAGTTAVWAAVRAATEAAAWRGDVWAPVAVGDDAHGIAVEAALAAGLGPAHRAAYTIAYDDGSDTPRTDLRDAAAAGGRGPLEATVTEIRDAALALVGRMTALDAERVV